MKFFQKRKENKWWLTKQDEVFIEEYSCGVRTRAGLVFLVGFILILVGLLFGK